MGSMDPRDSKTGYKIFLVHLEVLRLGGQTSKNEVIFAQGDASMYDMIF